MSKFANRSCNNCGMLKPANEMFKTIKTVKSGTSNTGISWGRTLWGIGIGDKGSERQFKRFFLSPNKRTYTRNREVWVCSNKCANALGGKSLSGGNSKSGSSWLYALVLFGWIPIVFIISGLNSLFEYNYFIGWAVVIFATGVILFFTYKILQWKFQKNNTDN